MVRGLRITEDGSISNKKVELYVLMRCEGIVSKTAAWMMTVATNSSRYQSRIEGAAVVNQRLEFLMAEKAELESQGIWGEIRWQAQQTYRRGVAIGDYNLMVKGTEMLLKVANRIDPAKKPDPPEPSERGPGRPPIQAPQPEDNNPDHFAAKLIDR